MAYNNKNSVNVSDSSALGCVSTIIFAIIAMPLAGLFLLCAGKSTGTKVIGFLLFVLGIIFWISMA